MTDDQPTTPKPKKPKFKYTRELVRIATHDGMTQQEIANLCRVEQSVVSGWQNGKSLAFDHQVVELKKRYGNRLNRTTSRVYLVRGKPTSSARWEDSERAYRLLKLAKPEDSVRIERTVVAHAPKENNAPDGPAALEVERKKLQTEIAPTVPQPLSANQLIAIDREQFEAERHPEEVTLVEGPIVLRYTFVSYKTVLRGNVSELARVPVRRWLVHHQGQGRFVLMIQERRPLVGSRRLRWSNLVEEVVPRGPLDKEPKVENWVDCADDAGRWISLLGGLMDVAGLISYCDDYLGNPQTAHSPHDELALPFLLRKMLVELGCDVPGVVRFAMTT
jgi:transcriptional regulator with XRE-family HTH domain